MQSRPFIHDDFLLTTRTARRLYHEFAAPEPIFDYHCHLSPRDIAENRQFENPFEIWLEGDHYKWRAMRSNGVAERFCTGDATPLEKFKAWAATVPHTLRNPLYHWTHLELLRYFGISDLLDESNAERIWHEINEQLTSPEFSTRGILKRFRVTTLCTTDDPTDDLAHHDTLRTSEPGTEVWPAFRPDAALAVNRPQAFSAWLQRLEIASQMEIRSLDELLEALRRRGEFFHRHGCRLSDHGLERCYAEPCSEAEAAAIFTAALEGKEVSPAEHVAYASFVMLFLGRFYAEKGWTMQLHLGALRNNNTRLRGQLGPDTGFDSIGDFPQAGPLATYLDRLDSEGALPRTILYNLNPADNYAFATTLGNFQDGSVAGKVQLGSGWWFLDQKEAMEWQLNALSNLGLLSRFVGMVTDSRSFMSYPRHEYFRRVLCNLLGREVESGELPDDVPLVGGLVRNICHENARTYFGFPS
ncbi:Glucuronate isomerase [Chthoniobacter flavus Ellin428]|uniref:Uronate isomerase n=1 Tax=Chthoniobacter flavus Ellin428 TaxID=497964 RepID=B4CUM8_9BACT|nr:glucuronate isomerase [Chthoniobacter flavus]EDY22266.1 Glucuronate isomerase [Chthoniobacter flavus Ellin428]TCO94715.1 D-glucuronate isomerase [Chthoniobacter flavus]